MFHNPVACNDAHFLKSHYQVLCITFNTRGTKHSTSLHLFPVHAPSLLSNSGGMWWPTIVL